jgi:hypothetical protein
VAPQLAEAGNRQSRAGSLGVLPRSRAANNLEPTLKVPNSVIGCIFAWYFPPFKPESWQDP